MLTIRNFVLIGTALLGAVAGGNALAQSDTALERIQLRAENRPLPSLARAAEEAAQRPVTPRPPKEMVNYRGNGEASAGVDREGPDPALQNVAGAGPAALVDTATTAGFDGAENYADNGTVNGYIVTPPDTDGQIGGANGQYFVQMVNSLTTIFDRDGTRLVDSFASNAFWAGSGGNCEPHNQGDPIVLYDEVADRWLVSQFAFPDSFNSFSQCVAISQTDDPRGTWNRYEFSFSNIGFNDYPKHGIVTDSITLMANLFRPRGPFFNFAGTFLGVMDKAAMYAGQPASLIGFNLGTGQFGFVAGDLDGPGDVPALFATAMSTSSAFDIWKIDVNWTTEQASAARIASIPITPFDNDLCSASREACIPQPDGGPALESLSDRLMHRLQIRDFGTYRTMLAAHTVDAGGGRAGIRWYEFRESGGSWSRYQEGTYAPADSQYRWVPSIAMNDRGDIGAGYLLGGPNTYMSVAVTGQTASASGTGVFDAAELVCVHGSGVHTDAARAGDYASTSIDPVDGVTFWHTNEYVAFTGQYSWNTYVCPFTIGDGGGGGGGVNAAPTAVITSIDCSGLACTFDGSGSSDSDGSITGYAWSFGDSSSATGVSPSHAYGAPGAYMVTLTVTDNLGATGEASQSITVSEPVDPVSLSVASIVVDTPNAGGGSKLARALVSVRDDQGNPVGTATVTGNFTGGINESGRSGVSGTNGVAEVTSAGSVKGKLKFTFCVSSISHGSLTYVAGDNAATCASN